MVWIPKIGIRESGDVTFYAGRAFALPNDGLAAEAGEVESKVRTRPPGKPPALDRKSVV